MIKYAIFGSIQVIILISGSARLFKIVCHMWNIFCSWVLFLPNSEISKHNKSIRLNLYMKSLIHRLIRTLPDELVFGSSFKKTQRIAKEYEASTDKADFISSYQQVQLKRIISIAEKASYHRNITDYRNFEDLPFTDKNIMQSQTEKFIVDKKGADLQSTGGTTSGRPLKFYIDKSRKGFEWYWMAKYNWGNVGFKTSDYRAVLRNHKLNGASHQIDHLLKEVRFDNHALKESYCDYIIDYIVKHDLKFVHAYPSA